jgi:hypothetical protein
VGIGTASPGSRLGTTANVLEVYNSYGTAFDASDPNDYGATIAIHNNSDVADTASTLLFTHRSSSTGYAGISSLSDGGDKANLLFFTRDSSPNTITERMRIDYGGNVGIATTNPAFCNLEVSQNGSAGPTFGLVSNHTGNAGSRNWQMKTNQNDWGDLVFMVSSGNNTTPNDTSKLRMQSNGHIYPGTDNAQDLGSSSLRWANIYTADIHFSNEGKEGGNEIDGTTGDWTIQEGDENLFVINNKTGKQYKMNLVEV